MSHQPPVNSGLSASDWKPTSSLEMLAARSRFSQGVRSFFYDLGFLEVHTPCLLPETVIDAHLDPLVVQQSLVESVGSRSESWFLQTSPEAAMKRLLASGAQAIFQLGPVFRGMERGRFHNPEFTMLEWYRVGDSMQAGIALLMDLVQAFVPHLPSKIITYRQLFQQTVGFDPFQIPPEALAQQVGQRVPDFHLSGNESRDDLLDVLLSFAIQPDLRGITVLSNYPISQAALARRSEDDTETAERFELFIDDVELANGYAELTDADVLRRRCAEQNAVRQRFGKPPLPPPVRLLTAMEAGLPPCAGTALGFDRLLMKVAGAESIAEVLPFAWSAE